MTDLTEIQSSGSTKIAGANSSGVEDNFMEVNADGSINGRAFDSSGNGISSTSVSPARAMDQFLQGLKQTVSTGNSSTALLTANSVFTGTFEDVSGFAAITLSIFTDQASAINGLVFQWSSDGTNVDRSESSSVVAATGRAFSITPRAKFFRVVYTNGAVNQGVMRLKTTYNLTGTGLITKPLSGSVNTDNFALLVQSPSMAKLADNTFVNIAGVSLVGVGLFGIADADQIFTELGDGFTVTTDVLSTGATTEVPYLLIDNPNASGVIARLEKVSFGVPSPGSGGVSTTVLYKLYMDPVVTVNGTALTVVGERQTGQDVAAVNFYTLPTVTSNGTKFLVIKSDSSGVAFIQNFNFSKLLESGHKILITATQSAAAVGGHINIEYAET